MRAAKLADGTGCNTKIRIPSMPTRYRLENWVEIFIGDKASAMSMNAQNTWNESARLFHSQTGRFHSHKMPKENMPISTANPARNPPSGPSKRVSSGRRGEELKKPRTC